VLDSPPLGCYHAAASGSHGLPRPARTVRGPGIHWPAEPPWRYHRRL